MTLRTLALAASIGLAAAAQAGMHEFRQDGTLDIDGTAARSATLHVACTPDRAGGALSIELVVPEANTRKDFDYDDFEGPDAEAGSRTLSDLAWTSAAGTTTIETTAAGWYAPEPPQAFMFGVSQLSGQHEAPAKLLSAVGARPGRLVWTQRGFDRARRLVARFELDAAAAAKLRDTVAGCLPQPKAKRPRA